MSSNHTVLITGANTGLGLEAVKALCRSTAPYTILLGCRSTSKGEDAATTARKEYPDTASTISVVQIDISSDESIEAAAASIASTYGKLDTLVNNAGANFDTDLRDGKLGLREAWNMSWDTNVSGTMVITSTFVPLLLKSSSPRVIFMTSGTSSILETEDTSDNPVLKRINGAPAAGWPKEKEGNPITAYRSSKAGMNMMMREWSRILREDGVKVFAVSPGFLATGLAGLGVEKLKKMGARDPSEGGNFIVEVVEGKHDENAGKAIRSMMIQPW